MLNDAEFNQYREECAVDEQWHNVTRHVIAELLEVCCVCDRVREKERLVRCPNCEDAYCCQDGICAEQHRFTVHPCGTY